MSDLAIKQKVYALFATTEDNLFGIEWINDSGMTECGLPWQSPHPEDMKIFRHLTLHNVVVMGRKTFESLGCKPLPDRINVVVSSGPPCEAAMDNIECWVPDIDSALEFCAANCPTRDVFFIGGKTLLTDLFENYSNVLDGVYHSVITNQWPRNPRVSNACLTYFNPRNLVNGKTLLDCAALKLVLDSQVIGMQKTQGITVHCSKLSKCRPKPVLMEVAECLILGKPTEFYTPSQSQVSMIAKQKTQKFLKAQSSDNTGFHKLTEMNDPAHPINKILAELNKSCALNEVAPETVAAISSGLSPLAVETAITRKLPRDRGMSGIDPFDVTTAWRKSVDEMDKYLNGKLSDVSPQKPVEVVAEQPVTDNIEKFLPSDFVGVATEIGELLVVKDAAYGSAFEKTKEILKILFPNGLPVEAFDDGLTIQRILDKICRLTVLCTNPDENKTDERTEDAWKDIAGYAIKALCEQRRKKTLTQ